MNTKKTLVLLLIALMLAFQVVPVSAQGKTPPNPDQLTAAQMKKAVVISDGSAASRPNGKGQIYRFANCDGADPDNPCYLMVTGDNTFTKSANTSSITPLSSSATLTCGINVYNYLGVKVAKFQENVNATFWGTYGQTPVTLNWGDLRGTVTYGLYYSWTSLSGPNPNPGWGVYVSRTGTAYATASGLLVYAPPPGGGSTVVVSSRLTINSSGWYCS